MITPEVHQALALCHEFNPAAIILDLQISDNEGWTVLDRLKHNVKLRHISVCTISRIKEQQNRALIQEAELINISKMSGIKG